MLSKRRLTHDTDALNVMKAMLARSGEVCFWGFTIGMHEKTINFVYGLARAMLWTAIWGRRRLEFPSWTWASVTGSILQVSTEHTEEDLTHLNVSIRHDGGLKPLQEWICEEDSRLLFQPSKARELYIEGDVLRVCFDKEYSSFDLVDAKGHLDRTCPEGFVRIRYIYFDIKRTRKTLDGAPPRTDDALTLFNRVGHPSALLDCVLLLLEWVGPSVAVRQGILRYEVARREDYIDGSQPPVLQPLCSRREKFILQ
jgi:hypothetical protein